MIILIMNHAHILTWVLTERGRDFPKKKHRGVTCLPYFILTSLSKYHINFCIFFWVSSPSCLNCFRHLLKEHSKILGERHPARRQNIVAILKNSYSKTSKTESGIVVGFCSLYFMDEGRIVVKMAFRVASQLRGQGTVFDFANFTLNFLMYID